MSERDTGLRRAHSRDKVNEQESDERWAFKNMNAEIYALYGEYLTNLACPFQEHLVEEARKERK